MLLLISASVCGVRCIGAYFGGPSPWVVGWEVDSGVF